MQKSPSIEGRKRLKVVIGGLFVEKPRTLRVERASPGKEFFNYLTGITYKTSKECCIVLTGTKGEPWVTSLEELYEKYTTINGKPFPNKFPCPFYVTPKLSDSVVYACQIPVDKHITVNTVHGRLVTNSSGTMHGTGDFLVYHLNEYGMPNTDEVTLVNGFIFPDIYKEVEKEYDGESCFTPVNSYYSQSIYS